MHSPAVSGRRTATMVREYETDLVTPSPHRRPRTDSFAIRLILLANTVNVAIISFFRIDIMDTGSSLLANRNFRSL
jgi:hypothetical protein